MTSTFYQPCQQALSWLRLFLFITLASSGLAQSVTINTQSFTFTGQITTWTVPTGVTSLTIEARGAEGGAEIINESILPGKGAILAAQLAVTPGQSLSILVGSLNQGRANGGGGSFVVGPGSPGNPTPLVIAGGGGGNAANDSDAKHGQPGPNGGGTAGGTAGQGGGTTGNSGGGSGLLSNGGGGDAGGKAFVNGGSGGAGPRGFGGFGGGGGAGTGSSGGGGGGGYSGGSGGGGRSVGGGGGSFTAGTRLFVRTGATDGNAGNGLVIISYLAPPVPTIIGFSASQNPVCVGVPVTYSATIGNVSGPYSYTLTEGNGFATSGNGNSAILSSTIVLNDSEPGIKTLTLRVVSNGQEATSSLTLIVNPNPVATLTPSGQLNCSQKTVTLTAGGGAPEATYRFSNQTSPISTSAISVSTAGPYSVTVTTPGGCSATATTIVSSNTIVPSVSVSPASQTICQGQTALFTAGGAATYQWTGGNGQPGQTSASISLSATGTYSVTGTGANGCTGTASAQLTVNELPQPPAILTQAGYSHPGGLSSLNVVQYSEPIILTVSGCEGGTINWNGEGSTTLTVSTSSVGTQTFLASCTRNGCTSSAASATVNVQPGPFQLIAPSYNCQTGGIAFRFQGGSGTPIEFFAIGVTGWTNNPYQFVDAQLRTSSDAGPLTLYARQDGQQVSYTFDLRAQCAASPNQAPQFNGPLTSQTAVQGGSFSYSLPSGAFIDPEGQPLTLSAINYPDGLSLKGTILGGIPTESGNFIVIFKATDPQGLTTQGTLSLVVQRTITGSPLQLLSPDYDCQSGAFSFKTSGGDGTPIEYFAIGITGWTTNPNQYVDEGLRTATDIQPLTLYARQRGKEVSFSFDIRGRCSGSPRQSVLEPVESKLQVSVLGNPVLGKVAELEIRGAAGQAVELTLTDPQGRALHQHRIGQAGAVERVSVPVPGQQVLLLLQVSTTTQRQQIKLIKP